VSATPMNPIKVLVVDDHQSVLWGLGKLIESARPGMQLSGTATSSAEALQRAGEHHPDVVLLDFDLGGSGGTQLISEMRERFASKVVVLTGMPAGAVAEQVVLAGACGFVHKSQPAKVILDAITHVHGGQLWLDSETVSRALASIRGKRADAGSRPEMKSHDALTVTERRIIASVVEHRGAPNKVIADTLHISVHTLRNHLASIYSKLDLHHRLDLVLYAQEHGLKRPAP
jgi:two-component system nitrate/nitrite response regulator NarL